jgi:predicted esterase
VVVPPDIRKGFNYSYVLRMPDCTATVASYLVVEPNNTGTISDDMQMHLNAALKAAQESSVGSYVAEYLNAPFLVPVFPRPETEWEIYTHALDRDSLLVSDGPMTRLDRQLLAMIENAQERLSAEGISVTNKSLFTGFSASGTFVNRFAAIHPEYVRAVAAGGLNGIAILPKSSIGGQKLDYPLGVNDFESVTGRTFQREQWLQVPQYLFMGELDTNDAVEYDDGYSELERRVVYETLGKIMQPDRWQAVQAEYIAEGATVEFVTYEGVGHGTNLAIRTDMAEFFVSQIAE